MNKSKVVLISIALNSIMNLIPVSATTNPYLACNDNKTKVYIDRDLKFNNQITAKSKFLGSAVYETTLTMQGKQLVARFDCRTEQSNISLDTKKYTTVDPDSCAGVLYKMVCGF